MKDLHKNLLISWQDLIQLGVISPNFPAQMKEAAFSASLESFDIIREKVVNWEETLSNDLGPNTMEIPGKAMHIYLQPNTIPSQISIARLVPLRINGQPPN